VNVRAKVGEKHAVEMRNCSNQKEEYRVVESLCIEDYFRITSSVCLDSENLEAISGGVNLCAKIVGGGSLGRGIRPTGLLRGVCHDGLEDVEVESAGTPGGRELEPENKEGLECIEPWEVVKDCSQGKALEEGEEAEYDPIGKPLNIILMLRRLDSLDGKIGRECPANEVGNWSGKSIDKDEERHESDSASNEGRLGDLSTLLEVVEHGVFRELLVELTMIVLCLCRGLLVHRVVLEILRSRHCG